MRQKRNTPKTVVEDVVKHQRCLWAVCVAGAVVMIGVLGLSLPAVGQSAQQGTASTNEVRPDNDTDDVGLVRCANLVYGDGQSSVCYADAFLQTISRDSTIRVEPGFTPVRLGSPALFEHPFAVMTGEGGFTLSEEEREQLRAYLVGGGFLVASPGCSNTAWAKSFTRELGVMFPEVTPVRLDMAHAVFHTVYEINELYAKKAGSEPYLMGLEIDGRVVMIYSPFGLNDSGNAGEDCCCCGGNEIRNARVLNVNILAYALTR